MCRGANAKLRRRKSIVLVALHEISETCWPQSNLSVIVIPRYLADLTCSNLCWWSEYSNWIWFSGRCRVTLIEWHLATLNFICQSVSHCARLFRSSCRIWQSMGDFIFLYKTQSSAKRRTDDLIISRRSLIKMIIRTGPKTDPWGTPNRTGTGSEAWPSNTTFWERSESHELIHLWVDPLIP